jgi:hypothetical protein
MADWGLKLVDEGEILDGGFIQEIVFLVDFWVSI